MKDLQPNFEPTDDVSQVVPSFNNSRLRNVEATKQEE
jgi:hypothetical protein